MTEALKSHPHLALAEHIAQVKQAMAALAEWHSPRFATLCLGDLADRAAALHDAGKASRMFQEYIRNPEGYLGDPQFKTHTPLSLLLTLTLGQNANWVCLDTLLLGLVVRGHHSGLATLPETPMSPGRESDLHRFAVSSFARVLKTQLPTVDFPGLEAATGFVWNDDTRREMAQSPEAVIRQSKRYLLHQLITSWRKLSEEEAFLYRLRTQAVFSVLLEADKALLAVAQPDRYLRRTPRIWQASWVDDLIGQPEETATNQLRATIRYTVKDTLMTTETSALYSLTAPTGSGKTFLAATWALTLRERLLREAGTRPKVIVVLPFLSVIDQTAQQYHRLLSQAQVEADGSWLLASHSLAQREYAQGLEEQEESFFLDTWRSELIVTTYDQFLAALLDNRARYQMRFHHLLDALIVLDEVQSLPAALWNPLDHALRALSAMSETKVLLMSATLPAVLSNPTVLLPNYHQYFRQLARYRLHFRQSTPLMLEDFIAEIQNRLLDWLADGERVLITLNTRASARQVFVALQEAWPVNADYVDLLFITADVTPKDRLERIERIKKNRPCVVVSTQTVEAGVDIDMTRVLRDFAPWDSLVQIAGRCNREGFRPREPVEIVQLTDDRGHAYADRIYDAVHLAVTHQIVEGLSILDEENALPISEQYFALLSARKDTGAAYLRRFARWQPTEPVREILRGKQRLSYTFLVLEQDPSLREAMREANQHADRWQRREAWRKLAARIAAISIEIIARPGFSPNSIADPLFGDSWALRPGYYSSVAGLNMAGDTFIY